MRFAPRLAATVLLPTLASGQSVTVGTATAPRGQVAFGSIVVPLANLASFRQMIVHLNPVDGKGMNRVNPATLAEPKASGLWR